MNTILRYREFITELFDRPVPYSLLVRGSNPIYEFTIKGIKYLAGFTYVGSMKGYNFGFAIWEEEKGLHQTSLKQSITDVGADVAVSVFATCITISKEFIENISPDKIVMLADMSETETRPSVYHSIISRNVPADYSYSSKMITYDGRPHILYTIEKIK